jgi:hypothetical protein
VKWFVLVCVLALTGCRAAAPVVPPAPAQSEIHASQAIWAEVPRQICTCHEDALSRVENVVQESPLGLEFQIQSGNEGWHIFSVTFDPRRAPPDQVTQLLKDAGALIIPAPLGR